jgi:hypothetical protein
LPQDQRIVQSPQQSGTPRLYLDNGDSSVSELGYGISTAGPPLGPQQAVVFSGQVASFTTQQTVTPTDQISGTASYAVPAGKKFYPTDINITSNSAAAFEFQIQAGARIIYRGWCKGDTGPIAISGLETQNPALAGEAISLIFGAPAGAVATVADYFVTGYTSNR